MKTIEELEMARAINFNTALDARRRLNDARAVWETALAAWYATEEAAQLAAALAAAMAAIETVKTKLDMTRAMAAWEARVKAQQQQGHNEDKS